MIDPSTLERSLKAFHAEDPETCEKVCREILAEQADHPLGGHLLAWSLLDRGLDYDHLLEELSASPETAKVTGIPAKATLGWLYWNAGRVREAILALTANISREPARQDLQTLLGICLIADEQTEPASQILGLVVKHTPSAPVPRFHLAHALLHLGDWERGFDEFERCRFDLPMRQPGQYDDMADTLWTDQELKGKRIVIEGEQGFGDQIQFIRFARYLKLKLKAAEVHFSCHPALEDLMQRASFLDSAAGKVYQNFDYHIPVMSLPHRCQARVDGDLYTKPYLKPDKEKVQKWQDQLPSKKTKPLVGICWRSAPIATEDHRRVQGVNLVKNQKSLTFDEFELLLSHLKKRFQLVSLQYDPGEQELRSLKKAKVFVPQIENFTDTACLIELCDHVVTIDTAAAHLAGALGAQTHILVARGADWRWAHTKDGCSVWYPDTTVHHQVTPHCWQAVIESAVTRILDEV